MAKSNYGHRGSLEQVIRIGILGIALTLGQTHPLRAEGRLRDGGSPVLSPSAVRPAQGATGIALRDSSRTAGTIVSQIHNAPGWQPSHNYSYATGPYTRVVNGSGWSPGTESWRSAGTGTYHPGQTLEAYQLISPGSCMSSSTDGPQGAGSAIQDGSCI